MGRNVLKHMTGEELLLVRILGGEKSRSVIEAELDRRAASGPPRDRHSEAYWAGRNHAMRRSARLAA